MLTRSLIVLGLFGAATSFAADAHTTTAFAGLEVNGGTVTHAKVQGRSQLRPSEDFVVPETPAPPLAARTPGG